ncbi:MAG: FkbM family methyltransferase [Vicinamibacterales bacterium]
MARSGVSYSWLRNATLSTFDRLGYQIRRKRAPGWGEDPYRDQQRLLEGTPTQVVFDVGANAGDTVAQFRALFPGALIHAFEPFPDAHRRLTDRFAADARVRTHLCAVTDAAGAAALHVHDADATNSLLPTQPGAEAWAGSSDRCGPTTIEVRTVTLDGFCAAQGLTQVDVLKMDIQGGEVMALRGARGLLERRAVRAIYVEVLFAPLYQGQAHFCDVSAILTGHGYQLFGLYNLVQGEHGLGWADALFRPDPARPVSF